MAQGNYLDYFMDGLLVKSPLKYVPIVPLGLVADTNRGLDNYYDRHGIKDSKIKNTMRHITGAGQFTRAYGAPITRVFGEFKESADFWNNNKDNVLDFKNNDLGINFIQNNPKATREDLMDYAYEQASKSNNLYNLLIDNQ